MPKKKTKQENKVEKESVERPPIIVVMGHIDHGKSTLLDYIRKSSVVDTEAGGITQRLSAYEVTHETKNGVMKNITFLDTPGHEAFSEMRSRGANVADIAILIVSAEDGVKQQTKEAFLSIKKANIPYIVAINKIDRPEANVEKTKQNLAESDIFVEGYGGDIPFVPISAKDGTGVDELLDIMLLVAEMEGLTGNANTPATGMIIESHLDTKKGISATLIIKDGTLNKGTYVVAGNSISPVRIFENFLGKTINEASFSSPVRITGWDNLPSVGSIFTSYDKKKEAENASKINIHQNSKINGDSKNDYKDENIEILPVVIKADVAGMIEAMEKEIKKLRHEKMRIKIIHTGSGNVTENDIKLASGGDGAIVIGFNVKTDVSAKNLADRQGITIKTFDIIYKMTEWLESEIKKRAPKVFVEEIVGKAKILKMFSSTKNKQVIGGKVLEGKLKTKAKIRIMRRENNIGGGEILGLQQQKSATDNVEEGNEFGTMIESTIEITPGDIVEAFIIVEKK